MMMMMVNQAKQILYITYAIIYCLYFYLSNEVYGLLYIPN